MPFKYLIFGFSHYYPGGGMEDCVLKTNKIQEVKNYVEKWSVEDKGNDYENLHVYDAVKDRLIYDAEFYVHDYFDKNARDLIVKINEL
ncbi:hypothetical protein [Bacillus sp. FSL K6-3431]|uniref:hypothetical protein n=1 Tax=Bacillus sp. FSL K6-3431 TaxID=2921500 RepID=UPI0030F8D5B1